MVEGKTVEISNQTKGKLPRLPFVPLKNAILGKRYILSIVFATPKISKELNNRYRGKNHPTNILSFNIAKNEGEIILEPKKIKTEYKDFGLTYEEFLKYLLIHGMLHLKGMDHSSTMDKAEKRFLQKFGIKMPNNLSS